MSAQTPTRTLDLGCGTVPRNPFELDELYGVDVRDSADGAIRAADLALEPIPFPDNHFEAVTAFDFIEHVPRLLYCPQRRYPFVELMNEIWRVLKPGGMFLSFTPAFPHAPVFQDPTHVNIITDVTFPLYFDETQRLATIYGFHGYFHIEHQAWDVAHPSHLVTYMRKLVLATDADGADAA